MVLSWPHGIREWVARATDPNGGDPMPFMEVALRTRRIAKGDGGFGDTRPLMREAFPDLGVSIGRSFALGREYYLHCEVGRALGLGLVSADLLREAGVLPFEQTGGRRVRRRGRYPKDAVDEIGMRVRETVGGRGLQQSLGLPFYGIEQLLCEGLLEADLHPALRLVFPSIRVRSAGLELLVERTLAAAKRTDPPKRAVALVAEARRIGGAPKPWFAIWSAMLDGSLPFWTKGGADARGIAIEPSSLDQFLDLRFDPSTHPDFPFSSAMHASDVQEMLNATWYGLAGPRTAETLPATTRGHSLLTDARSVAAYASEWVSVGELARRSRTSAAAAARRLATDGQTPVYGFCRRKDALALFPLR